MSDATPTETYQIFQAEKARLETELVTLKSSNDVSDLDTLARDQAKLDTIVARLPDLAAASAHYEQEQQHTAMLALQSARWAEAAEAKAAALVDIRAAVRMLQEGVVAYVRPQGVQMGCLYACPDISRDFRTAYDQMPQHLAQILAAVLHDNEMQRLWGLGQLSTFDAIGVSPTLPLYH